MKTLIIISILFLSSCLSVQPTNSQNTYTFREGTVNLIDGEKLMFFNIMIQDYRLDNGQMKEGAAASLSLPDQEDWITVGVGSFFNLKGVKYEIVAVNEGSSKGSVSVRKAN